MEKKSVRELLKEKHISEVVNRRLVTGTPDMSIADVVQKMQESSAGYIVLAENNRVKGIFTENDLVFKILNNNVSLESPVSEFMTEHPFILRPEDSIGKAIDLMGEHHFYHIPLVDDRGYLSGVLSVRTLIRFLAGYFPTEVYNLPSRVNQVFDTPEGG